MTMRATPENTKGLIGWSFYDWANSAFFTVISTFVFSAYVTKVVAETPERGTELWGYAVSASAFAVAVLAPVLGAITDNLGRRKPWIIGLTLTAALASCTLWRVAPGADTLVYGLAAFGAAAFCLELAGSFYNAMLPGLARPDRIGRWSGWAWGLGYLGGLVCLAVTLGGFVQAETPWFGLDKETYEHLRATGPLVGIWLILFSLPLFFLTPDESSRPVTVGAAARAGLGQLRDTLRHIRRHEPVPRFLAAHMLYADGLTTLFAFGGVYAAGAFGMGFDELIVYGVALNVTAGLGAAVFAPLDDRWGPKPVIVISIIGLTVCGAALVIVDTKLLFWVFGLPLGVFVGPAQAASRSMMARLAPDGVRTEMFGLYALSGKATAFLGPLLLAWTTAAFDSQRAGMATIILFFLAGLVLLLPVRINKTA